MKEIHIMISIILLMLFLIAPSIISMDNKTQNLSKNLVQIEDNDLIIFQRKLRLPYGPEKADFLLDHDHFMHDFTFHTNNLENPVTISIEEKYPDTKREKLFFVTTAKFLREHPNMIYSFSLNGYPGLEKTVVNMSEILQNQSKHFPEGFFRISPQLRLVNSRTEKQNPFESNFFAANHSTSYIVLAHQKVMVHFAPETLILNNSTLKKYQENQIEKQN